MDDVIISEGSSLVVDLILSHSFTTPAPIAASYTPPTLHPADFKSSLALFDDAKVCSEDNSAVFIFNHAADPPQSTHELSSSFKLLQSTTEGSLTNFIQSRSTKTAFTWFIEKADQVSIQVCKALHLHHK